MIFGALSRDIFNYTFDGAYDIIMSAFLFELKKCHVKWNNKKFKLFYSEKCLYQFIENNIKTWFDAQDLEITFKGYRKRKFWFNERKTFKFIINVEEIKEFRSDKVIHLEFLRDNIFRVSFVNLSESVLLEI